MNRIIHLLGDGLAGTWLAKALGASEVDFLHYGDQRTNTPPVAFVHFFQGRTFHRDPVEVEAFHKSIDFWSREPLAKEWKVLRTVKHGDRLHRSAGTTTVPPQYRPRAQGATRFEYAPGFTISAQKLVQSWRRQACKPRVEPSTLEEGIVVHATGLSIQDTFPNWRWDVNPGRTLQAQVPGEPGFEPSHIYLHKGCHIGGHPSRPGVTLGGRVNSKGEAKNDEIDIASKLLNRTLVADSEWWGKRLANALDRWPLIGWLDQRNFLFCGFGGRALFWLPYCSDIAVQALLEGHNQAVPSKLRADRLENNFG